jgi:hypothetical protein
MDDNTGEPNGDEVRLVADAIRFVPTDEEPDEEPNEEDIPLDGGLDEPDANPISVRPPVPDGGLMDARAPRADGDERQESLDGCDGQTRFPGEGPLAVWILIGLGVLRRQRAQGRRKGQ